MDPYTLILAILREAKEQGVAPVMRTSLVKFLYLLDIYTAQESEGTPITGAEWRFLHFGPFSPALAERLDELEASKKVSVYRHEARTGEKEFVLYNLGTDAKAPGLTDLGISTSIQTSIRADMKRYGKDLSALLDYVYFRTPPMADAKPGEVLDFSECRKLSINDVRPVEMLPLRPKAIKKARHKIRDLIQARKSQEKIEQGPFDEAYQSGLELLDDAPTDTGLTGKAKIKI